MVKGKSEDSLWRRDLSALGPFGAEANSSWFSHPLHCQEVSPSGYGSKLSHEAAGEIVLVSIH